MRSFTFLALLALSSVLEAAPPDPKGLKLFEDKIRPALVQHCYQCHSQDAQKVKKLRGGLFLDSRDGLRRGGDNGPALDLEKPGQSRLLQALRHQGDLKMPPKVKLPDAVAADFEAWIKLGAPDPRDGSVTTSKVDIEAGRRWWAFKPTVSIAPPTIRNEAWARTPIDRFLLARLDEKQLAFNGPAGKEKLIRRAFFDLWGLPPSPADLDVFLKDTAPDAYERLVDRLLQSEHYGERWARHWLDVVRFAESGGYEFDGARAGAYHYRDFVIKSLNQDMPYDQFIRLQLAGDHLNPGDQLSASATGFLVAGPYPGQTTVKTIELIRYDHLDDMLSTVGTSMLGLSFGCARCHDHKFDPIPQQDYYRLLACLGRTDSTEVKYNLDPESYQKAKADYDRTHTPLVAARDRFEKDELPGRLQKWLGAKKSTPPTKQETDLRALLQKPLAPAGSKERSAVLRLFRPLDADTNRVYQAVEEHAKKEPKPKQLGVFAATSGRGGDVFFLTRGEVERKNGIARPGFLQVLMNEPEQRWLADAPMKKGEPRVALANWMTDTERGAGHLLARVIVNRLWQHHLGHGLVGTPNDFGAQGELPTHPELLDWLAAELIRNGWKLKPIHRLIMTSAVYAQSGATNPEALKVDPQNRFWWRRPPRRLEAEAIRDAFLSVSGTLDATMYGSGSLDGNTPRRSVYLTVKRSQLIPLLQLFDAPEAIQSIGERTQTTVATQALALMNSPFVRQRAEKLAQRIRPKDGATLTQSIDEAYRIALTRRPTAVEQERMRAFIERQAESYGKRMDLALTDFCQVLLCLNEFVYVE